MKIVTELRRKLKFVIRKPKKTQFIGDMLTDFLIAKQNFRKIMNSTKNNYFENSEAKIK